MRVSAAVLIKLAAAGASAAGLASAAGPAHDAGAAGVEGAASGAQRLTVCADPNNLPFSNRKLEGFENKIIALIARDLGERIDYVWWAQRRGYVRSTLNESKCDIWPGVATGVGMVQSTRAYYRSTYVFVSRADAPLGKLTLDDPRLKTASIGVQMIGNDSMNTPPAHAIASRGIIDNVHGNMLYGDYDQPNPPAEIIKAVVDRKIDVALVWGPLAGYFSHRASVPMRMDAVTPAEDPRWPMEFAVSMGVRRGAGALVGRVNAVLEREQQAIDAILTDYQVPLEPLVPPPGD